MPALVVPPFTHRGLLLRPFVPSDLEGLAALVTSPEVMARTGGALRGDEVPGLLERYTMPDDPVLLAALAVLDAKAGTFVGAGLLRQGHPAPTIGFLVAPSASGRGVGTAIAEALITVVHTLTDSPRVAAEVEPDHRASIRVLERAGMRLVGRVDERLRYEIP